MSEFCSTISGSSAAWMLSLSLALGGCGGGTRAPITPAPAPSAAEHLAWGKRFAAEEQSVRAEQYYLSALELGADESQVFDLLVATCISSGRLGSALGYVERRLRERPDDARLLRLATSLREALGHGQLAWQHAARLEQAQGLSPGDRLFLAEFHERSGAEPIACLRYYRAYLDETDESEREPWVPVAMQRLEERARLTEEKREEFYENRK